MGRLAAGTESVVDHELCVDCHANANGKHPCGDRNAGEEHRDYVFYPFFPAASPDQAQPSPRKAQPSP